MKLGPLPDACRTHWNRFSLRQGALGALDPGFIAFQLARRTRTVVLMCRRDLSLAFGNEPPGSGAGTRWDS